MPANSFTWIGEVSAGNRVTTWRAGRQAVGVADWMFEAQDGGGRVMEQAAGLIHNSLTIAHIDAHVVACLIRGC